MVECFDCENGGMKKKPLLLGTVMAIALCCANYAETAKADGLTLSAATKKSAPARQRAEQGQIACTVAGCHSIPPGCHPQIGYNWDGLPTGFDIVVCVPPRGRRG